MAYDRQFLRTTWTFTVVGTEETAMTSVNWSVIPIWTAAEAALAEITLDAGQGQTIIDHMATLLTGTGVNWANFSRLVGIKIAAIGEDGHYLTDPKEFEDTTPAQGSSGTTDAQDTICVSLRSGSSFGSANFGRMYLPHTRLTRGSGPKSDASITGPLASAAAGFLDAVATDLNVQVTPTVQPFIMSNQAPKPSKPVMEVAVGDVTDTQRRRRAQLDETYSVVVL